MKKGIKEKRKKAYMSDGKGGEKLKDVLKTNYGNICISEKSKTNEKKKNNMFHLILLKLFKFLYINNSLTD